VWLLGRASWARAAMPKMGFEDYLGSIPKEIVGVSHVEKFL